MKKRWIIGIIAAVLLVFLCIPELHTFRSVKVIPYEGVMEKPAMALSGSLMVECTVRNFGLFPSYYKDTFGIERLVDGEWVTPPNLSEEGMVSLLTYDTVPAFRSDVKLAFLGELLEPVENGEYRLVLERVKGIRYPSQEGKTVIEYAPFTISNAPAPRPADKPLFDTEQFDVIWKEMEKLYEAGQLKYEDVPAYVLQETEKIFGKPDYIGGYGPDYSIYLMTEKKERYFVIRHDRPVAYSQFNHLSDMDDVYRLER